MSKFKEKYEQFKGHVKRNPEFYCYIGGATIGTVLGFAIRDGLPFPIRGDGFYASAETWKTVVDRPDLVHSIITDKWGDFVIVAAQDNDHYNKLYESIKEIQQDVINNT